jgi:multiple sugar transport system ATP-binding protein
VNDVAPKHRDVAMVFQNYALYPHMTVAENLSFPLRQQRRPKSEIRERVAEVARLLNIGELLERTPKALSGGQRQRVAMGRALIRRPRAFLMDEPLSNLDAKLRVQMRADIKKLLADLGVTTIYVTHDQVEAMTMGQRVAVMRKGELQQVDEPQTLYDRPVNLFVGGFIGSPAMNMIEATLERQNGGYGAKVGEQTLGVGEETLSARPALKSYVGRTVILGIRPEDLEDASLATDVPPEQHLHGKVDLTEALGSEIMVHFSIAAKQAVTDDVRELAHDVGDERKIAQLAEGAPDSASLVGRFGARSRVRLGQQVDVAVDSRALHFFDTETGLGIYDESTTKGAAS